MHVAVKRPVVQNAKLVDIEVQPGPATLAFASRMTRKYLQFAAVDPTFAEVRAAAQMALLAQLVWQRARNQDPADDLAIDHEWWLKSYPGEPVWTPETTPVGRAEKSVTTETRRPVEGVSRFSPRLELLG